MNSLNSTKLLKKLKAEEMKFNKLPKSKLYLDSDSVPLTLDVDYNFSNMYTPVFNDSLYIDISLTDILSLNMFNSEVEVDSNERSYASNKGINYLFYKNYLHTLNLDTSKSLPLAYSQVLNMYRSGFDESQFSSELFNTKDAWLGEGYSPMDNMDNRLYNTLKLRKPSRSFIQSFAAFQKVYRSRFDQSASHANISDLSNTPLKYLFLSEKRIKYESMLGKNTISYYDSVPYKNSTSNVPNFTSPLLNSTNTYFASIPFLLSRVSDSVKYT